MTNEVKLLERITVNPKIFNGKPIIRGRRLAAEGDALVVHEMASAERKYPWSADRFDVR